MSLPPNVIRVKRKRVEEAPVTFLQLDQGAKRHRSDSNWVYQRRGSTIQQSNAAQPQDVRPVIHISKPPSQQSSPKKTAKKPEPQPATETNTKSPAPTSTIEPRRFHVSRAMLAAAAKPTSGSVFKKEKQSPTLFVERTRRRKLAPKPRQSLLLQQHLEQELGGGSATEDAGIKQKDLKRPGVAKRAREAAKEEAEEPKKNPLPQSFMNRQGENMDQIAADMNDWVLKEVGASIESMNAEKKKPETHRFKPKAPAKRYAERHPQVAAAATATAADGEGDVNMSDGSEEEGDDEDWIIEEYIRIPANTMAIDVNPSEMGFLVLEGEEESLLFFGPQNDDDDEWAEDEEDENAENYYTADYPEDEVNSEDEFDRQAYCFRNGNASDDEEYDQDNFDDDVSVEGQEDDDDARMTRILEQMKRLRASQQ